MLLKDNYFLEFDSKILNWLENYHFLSLPTEYYVVVVRGEERTFNYFYKSVFILN